MAQVINDIDSNKEIKTLLKNSDAKTTSEIEAESLKKTRVLEGKEEVFGLKEAWEKDEARRREDME